MTKKIGLLNKNCLTLTALMTGQRLQSYFVAFIALDVNHLRLIVNLLLDSRYHHGLILTLLVTIWWFLLKWDDIFIKIKEDLPWD